MGQADALGELKADTGIKLAPCDVDMPDLDGLSMAEKVRGELRNTAVNLLVRTTENSPALKERGKRWIVKPFNGPAVTGSVKKQRVGA